MVDNTSTFAVSIIGWAGVLVGVIIKWRTPIWLMLLYVRDAWCGTPVEDDTPRVTTIQIGDHEVSIVRSPNSRRRSLSAVREEEEEEGQESAAVQNVTALSNNNPTLRITVEEPSAEPIVPDTMFSSLSPRSSSSPSVTTPSSAPASTLTPTQQSAVSKAIGQVVSLWSKKQLTLASTFTMAFQSVQSIRSTLSSAGVSATPADERMLVEYVLQQLLTTYLPRLDPYASGPAVSIIVELIPLVTSEAFSLFVSVEQEVAGCFGRKKKTVTLLTKTSSSGGLHLVESVLHPDAAPAVTSSGSDSPVAILQPQSPLSPPSPSTLAVPTFPAPITMTMKLQ